MLYISVAAVTRRATAVWGRTTGSRLIELCEKLFRQKTSKERQQRTVESPLRRQCTVLLLLLLLSRRACLGELSPNTPPPGYTEPVSKMVPSGAPRNILYPGDKRLLITAFVCRAKTFTFMPQPAQKHNLESFSVVRKITIYYHLESHHIKKINNNSGRFGPLLCNTFKT